MRKLLLFSFVCIILLILMAVIIHRLPRTNSTVSTLTTTPSPIASGTQNNTPKIGSPVPFSLTTPQGYSVSIFAMNLGNPRDLEITEQGTLLVSVPSINSVIALLDENMDGIAEPKTVLRGENTVHGLAFHNGKLYVAEKNSVKRYSFDETSMTATLEKKIMDLPGESNHIYRTLVFGDDKKLYVSIGSNCNVCYEPNPFVGSVIVANEDGSNPKVFAKGQRNAPFLAVDPLTNQLFATGMGRDHLGDDLPPDEINILKNGADYGWPVCYGNKIHDTNFDKKTYIKDPCSDTIPPIFEIPAHSAPLGLTFIPSSFSPEWEGDLLVAYHGSWNRSVKTGYSVVRLERKGDTITKSENFITGFLEGNTVFARPVDLIFDKNGTLYLSDDRSGYIFALRKD